MDLGQQVQAAHLLGPVAQAHQVRGVVPKAIAPGVEYRDQVARIVGDEVKQTVGPELLAQLVETGHRCRARRFGRSRRWRVDVQTEFEAACFQAVFACAQSMQQVPGHDTAVELGFVARAGHQLDEPTARGIVARGLLPPGHQQMLSRQSFGLRECGGGDRSPAANHITVMTDKPLLPQDQLEDGPLIRSRRGKSGRWLLSGGHTHTAWRLSGCFSIPGTVITCRQNSYAMWR